MASLKDYRERLTTREEPMLSRRHITISGYANSASANLIGGNFMVGLLLLLNADPNLLAIVAMTGVFGNLFQIFAPLILERFTHRKRILVIARIITYLCNIVIIGGIPFLHIANSSKLVMIIAVISLLSLMNSLIGPGYSVWHIKSIPEESRRGFFSFFQVTNTVIAYIFIMIGSLVLDYIKKQGFELAGLTLLRGFALLVGVVDIFFLMRVKEYPNPVSHTKLNLKDIFILPFLAKKYMPSVILAVIWSFTANFTGMYFSAYLLKNLEVEYSFINLIAFLSLPVLILMTPFWNRFILKHSWFKTLFITLLIFAMHHILLAFVTKTTLFFYPISLVIYFAIVPALNIIFASMPYHNIPETNQTNYIGFYTMVSTVAALAGIYSGRFVMLNTVGVTFRIFGMTMVNNQYLLLLNACVTLILSLVVLYIFFKMRKIDKEQTVSL